MGNNQSLPFLLTAPTTTPESAPTIHMDSTTVEDDGQCIVSVSNVSKEMIDNPQTSVEYYICGPILTLFIIFGVLGNAVCMRAFQSTRRRSAAAISLYFIVLAAWDLVLVVSSFFLYNLSVLMHGFVPVYGDYVRTYASFFALANASHTASIWCVVAMAGERYFALVYPLQHRRATDHATRARRTLACLSVLSILVSIPKFFEVRLGECLDLDTGRNTTFVTSSDLRRHPAYSIVYIVIGGLLFHSLAPFALLVILSIRVIIEVRRGDVMHRQISVRRSNKRVTLSNPGGGGQQGGDQVSVVPVAEGSGGGGGSIHRRPPAKATIIRRNSSKTSSVTSSSHTERSGQNGRWTSESKSHEILPLAVVAKFFICHSLPTVLDIFERLTSEENFEGPWIDLLVDLSNSLVVMNSSVNFLLYIACSVHFRHRVVSLVRSLCMCDEEDSDDAFDSHRTSTFSPASFKKKSDSVVLTTETLLCKSEQHPPSQ